MNKIRLFCLVLALMFIIVGCKTRPNDTTTRNISTTDPVPQKKPAPVTTKLHRAARAGDVDRVQSLISSGADLNTKDRDGWTPLHEAIEEGSKDVIELLIANGADVHARDGLDSTPLHNVFLWGQKDVVELLIANGADINAKDQDGCTPLHSAIDGDYSAYDKEFFEANNIDINAEYKFRDKIIVDMVTLLIAHGADVNAEDKYGGTPLYDAALWGYRGVAELLITNGANVNKKSEDGMSILQCAVSRGFEDIVELLVTKGANVNTIDNQGRTPLHLAIKRGNKEIVELLREYEAKE